ncbi:MOSC domain-containing protein [Pseudozyma hubeiensis]|nr:MOSC domain-containing protein [Pseudozyma hubeiensis]
MEMYGDYADGRVAALPDGSDCKSTPSEWLSRFLGYPALLLHFDTTSSTTRDAFPIFKPPTDSSLWSTNDRSELHRKRGIEFQDEYPLLVASQESLDFVRSQLFSALASSDSDGRGGRRITGIDATKWSSPEALNMARFRPNIVIKGNGELPAFSEDSWERIWILPNSSQESSVKAILQLVARCQRCLLTAVDPISAEKDPSVPLKLLNRSRMRIKKVAGVEGGNGRAGPCFGMYAIPLPLGDSDGEGRYGGFVKGDAIRVRWRPFETDDEPDRQRAAQ